MTDLDRILIVDDSCSIRGIVRHELEEEGYEVIEAENGEDALTKLKTIENIKLITLDVEMPVMSGFQALEAMRTPELASSLNKLNNDNIPVIFVTSKDTPRDRHKGFTLGATEFIGKPFAPGEVGLLVNRILKPSEIFKDLTILMADDDAVVRRIIVFCLKQLGVSVYESDDGDVAYEILKSQMNNIDMLITDLHMSNMNGDELCRKVRGEMNLWDLPIIVISSNTESDVTLDLFKAGASDYLTKPFVREELIARLSAHLERQKLNKILKTHNPEMMCSTCNCRVTCECHNQ